MRARVLMTAICIGLLATLTASAVPTLKHSQLPDLSSNHLTVLATTPTVLADDFLCTDPYPITRVTIWGSWRNDTTAPGTRRAADIRLSIHDDIPDPDGDGPEYSMPGTLRWQKTFTPAEYTTTSAAQGLPLSWYDPNTGIYTFSPTPPAYAIVHKYTFDIAAADAFVQEGTPVAARVYWLDVEVFPQDQAEEFGWEVSQIHCIDDAVWDNTTTPNVSWGELRYPMGHQYETESIDLAFIIWGEEPEGEPAIPEPAGLGLVGLALLGLRKRRS